MTQARPKTTMSHGLRAVPQCLLVPVLLWQGVSYADWLFVGSSNAPGGPRHGPHLKMQRQAAGGNRSGRTQSEVSFDKGAVGK